MATIFPSAPMAIRLNGLPLQMELFISFFAGKASFFPAIPHFIADFNDGTYFFTKSLP